MVVLAFVIEPERMYSGTYKIDKELEQYSQAACVDITGDLGSFTSGVQELLKFQEVCVVPDDSSELLVQYNTGENDTLVLFIGGRGAVAVRDGRTGGADHGPEHGNCVERCPTGRL